VKTQTIVLKRLDRVSLGNLGDYRSVGGGVYELRIDYGSGYRVYFGQVDSVVVLLLCGGDKSTQEQDIVDAKEYWKNYGKR
jgi:putative addiction module killer protein